MHGSWVGAWVGSVYLRQAERQGGKKRVTNSACGVDRGCDELVACVLFAITEMRCACLCARVCAHTGAVEEAIRVGGLADIKAGRIKVGGRREQMGERERRGRAHTCSRVYGNCQSAATAVRPSTRLHAQCAHSTRH